MISTAFRPGASITCICCGSSRNSITAFPAPAGCAASRTGSIRPFRPLLQQLGRVAVAGGHDLIAIDGKTARRTHDQRKSLKALHTLSAYANTARLVLAQSCLPEKTNEITTIPDLLDDLAENGQPEGALVTIDAMGCQVEIADKIVAHNADYLLAFKGNQSTLETDVEDYFRTAPAAALVSKTTVEKGHGRIETRIYTA